MDPQFDRYNPHRQQFDQVVNSIVEQAYGIVRQNGYGELRTAHVLFCALNEPSVVEILQLFSVEEEELRQMREVCVKCFPTDRIRFDANRPTAQSFACHEALNFAFEETVRRGRSDLIGVAHLLIGLAREPTDVGGALLRQHGLTLDRLRKWNDHETVRPKGKVSNTTVAALQSQVAEQRKFIEQLDARLSCVQEQVLALSTSLRRA
jgi:ATP-dependent Clp protease ATP-binding subunit ClpA